MTHEEAYHSFKETCREEVKILMAEHGRRMLEEVSKRPQSRDKDYSMELARDKIPNRFPSLSWFLDQRPPEVQFCNDHATGLCKVSHTHLMKCHRIILHCHEIFAQVCESARINFESYRRAVKAACKCRTNDCPAWACWCYDVEGEEEQDDICYCVGCDCDVCSSCKVKSL